MAIARFKIRQGKKGKATPHARYIAREGSFKNAGGKTETVDKGHGNMPQWAEKNPLDFWKSADKNERKNGYTYREHEIALPREFDRYQNIKLVEEWIKQELPNNPYQYAIHTKMGMDGKRQPHVHLMFSEREQDGIQRDKKQFFKRANSKHPEKGGAKKASNIGTYTQRQKRTQEQRYRLGDLINKHLEINGFDERIDMRTLEEQGINREPINIDRKDLEKPNIKEKYQQYLEIKKDNQTLNVNDKTLEKINTDFINRIKQEDLNKANEELKKWEEEQESLNNIMAEFEQWEKEQEPQQQEPQQIPKQDREFSR